MRPSSSEGGDLAQRVAQLESLVQASLGGQAQPQVSPILHVSDGSDSNQASESAVQVAAAALGELSQQQDRMQGVEDVCCKKHSAIYYLSSTTRLAQQKLIRSRMFCRKGHSWRSS